MGDTITPPDYLRVGATVAVVGRDHDGVQSVRVREVAKINKQRFTVHGITENGKPDGRPVQFRNEGSDGTHTAAGQSNHERVYREDHPELPAIRARLAKRRAFSRVRNATFTFDKLAQNTTNPYPDRRPTDAQVDDALAELAAAAIALREVLGVPGGE